MSTGDGRPLDAHSALIAALPRIVGNHLPAYLPRQRWFGDKAREIAGVALRTALPIAGDVVSAFAIVEVSFADGGETRYALPLAVVPTAPVAENAICGPDEIGRDRWLVDGFELPAVRDWVRSTIAAGDGVAAADGRLAVDTLPAGRALLRSLADAPNRVLGVDQSNTALDFGSDALIKVFRRLQPGINPDVELTRFLSARTAFANLPAYLGSLSFGEGDGAAVLAVAQRFVENEGNGWEWVLGHLRAAFDSGDVAALLAGAERTGRRLGEITADLHLALASDPWTPALAPEPIRATDVARWAEDYLAMLDRVERSVRGHLDRLSGQTLELARSCLALAPGLRARARGFDRLVGRVKTRVHGDYHLGQTLIDRSGDFVVLDFEGEPQRSIEERRRKTSPLKDVAGMLRSFAYARGTAAAWLGESTPLLASDLVAWERTIRAAFLAAYAGAVAGGNVLPAAPEDARAAIAAWELDKAAYEVLYELNNRPAWLWIPLSAMIKQGEPDRA